MDVDEEAGYGGRKVEVDLVDEAMMIMIGGVDDKIYVGDELLDESHSKHCQRWEERFISFLHVQTVPGPL
jgi:hypothetical protein